MIIIYTDGACRGNGKTDAVGGWGFAVYSDNEVIFENYGGEIGTTNNRMELQAVIEALSYATDNFTEEQISKLTIVSDSNYVIQGITQWFHGWIKKNWKDVKNDDLWKKLLELYKIKFSWQWCKGHEGNIGNEHADNLANKGCDKALVTNESEQILDKKRERFINAMYLIYRLDFEFSGNLFDQYLSEGGGDPLTYLIFKKIINDEEYNQ